MPTSFRCAGTTGQAPTTTWFGKVPDRLNLCQRAYNQRGTDVLYPSQGPADLVSKWIPYNQSQNQGSNVLTATFGANTLAPDGTNNAIKVVETTSNSNHAVVSLFRTGNITGNYQLRLSVFAKAAERTRFTLSISNGNDPATPAGAINGCITVFDLAGGQVGVPNTVVGAGIPPFVAKGQEIVAFGNGWYRCTMDVVAGQLAGNFCTFTIGLDNGSGTGAISNIYTGDGASGVYFWRSTCLPPRAWGLNTVTFFDDFTSLNTIDLNNTKAPGFNWYINTNWPHYITGLPVNDRTNYSIISGTILKTSAPPNTITLPMTAVSTGGTNYNLGFLVTPPFLVECSVATDDVVPGQVAFWEHSLALLLFGSSEPNLWDIETDWFEYPPGGANFPRTTFAASPRNVEGLFDAWSNIATWRSAPTYPGGTNVAFGGIVYNAPSPPTQGVPPPNSPWVALSPQPLSFTAVDFTQQHVSSVLTLPDGGDNDCGQAFAFLDGAYIGQPPSSASHFIFGRRLFNQPGPGVPSPEPGYYFVGDTLPAPLILQTPIGFLGTTYNNYWDFVRVTQ